MPTGFWLLDHPNTNGPYFHTSRIACKHGIAASRLPHLIVIHTAESLPDFEGEDTSGEALAKYASTNSRSVSWYATVDSDGVIPMIPDSYVGAHVIDYNRCSVGMEICTKAGLWAELAKTAPQWYESIMANAANQAAWWCKTHDIQPAYLTKAEVDAGGRGITSHARLDPARRSDPGTAFAWERFIGDVSSRIGAGGYMDQPTWPAWAAPSIQKAIDKRIMVGDGKKWLPGNAVTRAELAQILDRLGQLG